MIRTTLLIVVALCFCGCQAVPASKTTTQSQKNLAKENTIFQIEILRRHYKMDQDIMYKFLVKNVEYAIAIEEILTGVKGAAALKILEKTKGEVLEGLATKKALEEPWSDSESNPEDSPKEKPKDDSENE